MSRFALGCAVLALLTLSLVAPSAHADPTGSDFTIAPNPPNPGDDVTFTFVPGPSIAGTPDVDWDIRGNPSFDETGPSATQAYDQSGSVMARMRVTDDDGSLTISKPFTVNAPPVVSFDFTPASPFPGQEVWFDQVVSDPDGDSVTLAWSFGDGGTASGEDPRHTYATDGTRTVTLTATDEHELATVETRQLTVQDAAGPTAGFSVSPLVPLVGQAITFINTSMPSSGQSITSSVWDLDNDGEFDDSASGWSFGTPGNHTVALRVTQSNGNQAVFEKGIRVNAPPTAAFVWSPLTPVANQPVDLISTSSDVEGALTLQEWDLDNDGDFDDATGESVTHAFAAAGTPTVRLRVTDSDGVVRTVARQITVLDRPFAAFTFSPAVPLVGEAIAFTDQSTASSGSITETAWDLDDDGVFDDDPTGWSFGSAGNHSVAVRVKQTNGEQSTGRLNIRVNAPPGPGFVWSPVTPVAGEPADLVSTSIDLENALGAQSWDLDADGQFVDASGPAVSYAFPSAGTYDVGLQVTDSDGVARTIRRAVTVAAPVRPAQVNDEPGFITPFPVVRLAGKVLPRGALVQVLAVRAPRGTLVRVTCAGKGCPARAVRRTSRGASVRFGAFERRLRAGIRLEIFMRKPGTIGKYTRFVVRAGKGPLRTDRCLFPGVARPRACP